MHFFCDDAAHRQRGSVLTCSPIRQSHAGHSQNRESSEEAPEKQETRSPKDYLNESIEGLAGEEIRMAK